MDSKHSGPQGAENISDRYETRSNGTLLCRNFIGDVLTNRAELRV